MKSRFSSRCDSVWRAVYNSIFCRNYSNPSVHRASSQLGSGRSPMRPNGPHSRTAAAVLFDAWCAVPVSPARCPPAAIHPAPMRYSSVERGRSSRLHLPKGSSAAAAAAAAAVSPQLNLCYIYILRAPASIVVVNSESQLTTVFWPQFGYSQKISMHLLRNWWLLYAVMSVALPGKMKRDINPIPHPQPGPHK